MTGQNEAGVRCFATRIFYKKGEDIIIPLGLTITEAAGHLKVSRKTLSALLNCKTSLTPEMAVRIAKATGTTPESWLYMQAKSDIWNAEQKAEEIEAFREIIAV
ncbi:HigA family addiction module antitoxin [Desulfonema magnum]|uniref:Toxin-antitoxin system, antitoxin component n=1 Tax=Desulfonema magnum TaxID=45655 RepID=A0A975BF71_9BACT|nr:HigA family addiction module antitoxin [Desulfonema magnum]QTA84185.1 Toxin-antitoxin system, antitoxin component [Desulfonema magnum]